MSNQHLWLTASFVEWVDVVVNQLPVVATIWITVVGGCIGSFMNVVIYRLPAGMSLVHPPSHCPKCEQPIRARDNLPVIGWLLLRGRCRDCGVAIPSRYPLVEAAVAFTFLMLWLVDVVWPGEIVFTNVRIAVFGLDALLLCCLICIAMIEVDGQETPWRLVVFPIVTLLLVTWMWPVLLFYLQRYQYEVSRLVGIAGGAVLGGGLGWIGSGGWRPGCRRRGPIMTGVLTGAYLSWAAVSMIAGVTAALLLVTRWQGRRSVAARWSLLFTAWTLLALVSEPLIDRIRAEELLSFRLGILAVAIALTSLSGWLRRN